MCGGGLLDAVKLDQDGALTSTRVCEDALHNSLRMGVVQVGMSCKAYFAVQ